jgi:hypothetical protein
MPRLTHIMTFMFESLFVLRSRRVRSLDSVSGLGAASLG